MTVRPSARIPHRMSTTRGVFTALFAAGVAIFAGPGVAQAQMPPDIAAKIAALGRVVDPANTGKIYAPLQEKEPYAGVKVARDRQIRHRTNATLSISFPQTVPPPAPPVRS